MARYLRPSCVYEDTFQSFVSSGHILPCCYVDGLEHRCDVLDPLFSEHLKVINAWNVENIVGSDEWIEFFYMLMNEPERAPKICWDMCHSEVENPMDCTVTKREVVEGTHDSA